MASQFSMLKLHSLIKLTNMNNYICYNSRETIVHIIYNI